MSQPNMKRNLMTGTLRGPGVARSVLLRMAADQERAERIRQLKQDHPDMRWNWIADQVGVRERSALAWAKDGGISPENAKKLAAVFGVSYEYLWFGPDREPSPDLMTAVKGNVEHVGSTVQGGFEEFRTHVQGLHDHITKVEQKLDRNVEVLSRLLEVVGSLTAESVAQAVEQAAAPEGQGEQSGRAGNASSNHSTQG